MESFLYHLLALLAAQHKLRAFGDCGDCVGWWWMMCMINEEQEDGLELSPTCLSVSLSLWCESNFHFQCSDSVKGRIRDAAEIRESKVQIVYPSFTAAQQR